MVSRNTCSAFSLNLKRIEKRHLCPQEDYKDAQRWFTIFARLPDWSGGKDSATVVIGVAAVEVVSVGWKSGDSDGGGRGCYSSDLVVISSLFPGGKEIRF